MTVRKIGLLAKFIFNGLIAGACGAFILIHTIIILEAYRHQVAYMSAYGFMGDTSVWAVIIIILCAATFCVFCYGINRMRHIVNALKEDDE